MHVSGRLQTGRPFCAAIDLPTATVTMPANSRGTNSPDFPRLDTACFRPVPSRKVMNRHQGPGQTPLKNKVFGVFRIHKKVAASPWGRGNRIIDCVSLLEFRQPFPRILHARATDRPAPIPHGRRRAHSVPPIADRASAQSRPIPADRPRRSGASRSPRCGRRCGTSPTIAGMAGLPCAPLALVFAQAPLRSAPT
jgi:hypothetical protein